MTRKQNSLIADMEEVLTIWTEKQINHNTPLRQETSPEEDPNSNSSMKAERGERVQMKSLKLAGLVLGLRKRSHLCNMKA